MKWDVNSQMWIDDGQLIVKTSQDAEPYIEENKRLQNEPVSRHANFRKVASIPISVIQIVMQEMGFPHTNYYALNQDERRKFIEMLNKPEYRDLRTTTERIGVPKQWH